MIKEAVVFVLLAVVLYNPHLFSLGAIARFLQLPFPSSLSSSSSDSAMSWSAEFSQRRAECLPYQMLRQKAWELVLNDESKGPWSWQADLEAGTFSITYSLSPQHNIDCSSGDLQLLSTWDRDSTQSVLLSWDNPPCQSATTSSPSPAS